MCRLTGANGTDGGHGTARIGREMGEVVAWEPTRGPGQGRSRRGGVDTVTGGRNRRRGVDTPPGRAKAVASWATRRRRLRADATIVRGPSRRPPASWGA